MTRGKEKAKRRIWRPQFSVRTLAIVVALAAFGVWWWVTWPARTANKFLRLLSEEEFEDASRMMVTADDREFMVFEARQRDINRWAAERGLLLVPKPDDIQRIEGDPEAKLVEQSWSDILLGRGAVLGIDVGLFIQRGRVSFEPFVRPD